LKERIGHRRVVMLSGVNDEREERLRPLFHSSNEWGDLHEVWPRTNDVNNFEHF
jgi:hypothetical protein